MRFFSRGGNAGKFVFVAKTHLRQERLRQVLKPIKFVSKTGVLDRGSYRPEILDAKNTTCTLMLLYH